MAPWGLGACRPPVIVMVLVVVVAVLGSAGLATKRHHLAARIAASQAALAKASTPPANPANGHRLLLFLGVMSAPVTTRRTTLRSTWLGDHLTRSRREMEERVVTMFVVGRSPDIGVQRAVANEARTHGDIMMVDIHETYNNLPLKTLRFFRTAVAQHDAEFYFKVDDDMHVVTHRWPAAVQQWRAESAGYIGCANIGSKTILNNAHDWYYPLGHMLLHNRYHLYMAGGMYGLSARSAAMVAATPDEWVRLSGCEDASLGLLLLTLRSRHVDDRRICHEWCETDSLAVWPEMYCHTNCNNSATLVGLHKDPTCKNRTANFGSPWHPSPAGGLHVLKPGQLDRMDWA